MALVPKRMKRKMIYTYHLNDYKSKCPDGSFIGYKIVVRDIYLLRSGGIPTNALCLLKLEIPEDAKRLSPFISGSLSKCRCNKVKVLQAYDVQKYLITKDLRKCRIKDQKIFYSFYDKDFEYRVGETISVDNFDESRYNPCSAGIHFFMKKEDAMRYFAIPMN